MLSHNLLSFYNDFLLSSSAKNEPQKFLSCTGSQLEKLLINVEDANEYLVKVILLFSCFNSSDAYSFTLKVIENDAFFNWK